MAKKRAYAEWGRQPIGPVGIEYDHARAEGLVFFAPLSGAHGTRDLVKQQLGVRTGLEAYLPTQGGAIHHLFGTSNYAIYSELPDLSYTEPTTIAWTQEARSTSGYSSVLNIKATGATYPFLIFESGSDANYYFVVGRRENVLGPRTQFNSPAGALTNDRLSRFVLTLPSGFSTGSGARLWRDGVELAGTAAGVGSAFGDNTTADFRIGARDTGADPFEGLIGDMRIWSRVLPDGDAEDESTVQGSWKLYAKSRILGPVSAGGGGTTVSVPSGSLTLTGFAPTVSATANQTIAVPAGALTLAGFAPTVNVGANQTISVPAGSLTITGFAPTVNVGVNQNIAVPAGSLTLTGFAPTISTSANQPIAVPVGSLTLTGFAPTVVQTAHQTISVPLGTLVMAGYAPTVSASGSYTISVPLGALTLTGYAPVVNNSGATVTVTVKLGSWIRYKKITSATSTLYGLDPTLNTGFFSYSGTNNLILTKLASSAANYLARSSAAKSSGLRYFAFVNTSEAANDGTHIGVIQSSCPLSYPGADANGYGCQINRAAGVGLWNAGSFTSLGGSALVGVGDTGMMAVNFTLGYIWYGRNGTWFNSGDPAAGTGPNQTFAPGTTFYAVISEGYISVRTCYSLSGAPYAPPSGFSYWDA